MLTFLLSLASLLNRSIGKQKIQNKLNEKVFHRKVNALQWVVFSFSEEFLHRHCLPSQFIKKAHLQNLQVSQFE